MTPALSAALAAFDRIAASDKADSMTFAEKARQAARETDYPPEALMKALIAETEARG